MDYEGYLKRIEVIGGVEHKDSKIFIPCTPKLQTK